MKTIPFLTLSFLFLFCNTKQNKNSTNKQTPTLHDNKVQVNSVDAKNFQLIKKLNLPSIGLVELNTMTKDSLNSYGEADCWGNIVQYSNRKKILAIDSVSCGEYGYTYRYYIINKKGIIEKVYTKNSEPIINQKTNHFIYLKEELIIDFKNKPATSKTRVDTVYNSKKVENEIKKQFLTENLSDVKTTYEFYEMEYKNAWNLKSEE